jgi:carbon storage regulator
VLIASRRTGEAIRIDGDIEVVILSITPARVKLGITAPQHVRVVRREALLVEEANTRASNPPEKIASALSGRVRAAPPFDVLKTM